MYSGKPLPFSSSEHRSGTQGPGDDPCCASVKEIKVIHLISEKKALDNLKVHQVSLMEN